MYSVEDVSKWPICVLVKHQNSPRAQPPNLTGGEDPFPTLSQRISCCRTLATEGAATLIMRRAVKETLFLATGAFAKAMALAARGLIRIIVVGLIKNI